MWVGMVTSSTVWGTTVEQSSDGGHAWLGVLRLDVLALFGQHPHGHCDA